MESVRTPADAALTTLSASTVFDAQGKRGALPPQITRVHGEGCVAGPVVTAACAEGSVTAILAALDTAQPGSVLLAQGDGDWAYLGELIGSEAVRVGVVAVVVDGYVRDAAHLRELPLPVFARGLTPRGARFGPNGQPGATLTVGETRVHPGDWAVGDEDGVTIVPAADFARVTIAAEALAGSEGELGAAVLAGHSLLDHGTADGGTLRDLLD